MTLGNGHFKEGVEQIKNDVREMKDDLTTTISRLDNTVAQLSNSVNYLTEGVNGMTDKIQSAMELNLQAIPLPFVLRLMKWTFGILVIALIGVEGSQWLFEHYLRGK